MSWQPWYRRGAGRRCGLAERDWSPGESRVPRRGHALVAIPRTVLGRVRHRSRRTGPRSARRGDVGIAMARILDGVCGPGDLKELDDASLKQLAQEIRDELAATIARTGGHLSPNLGTVELTLALHTVFDSPRDRIVWD